MDVDRSTRVKVYCEWVKRTSCHNCMYKYENIHTCAGILRIRVCINRGSKIAEHSASYVAVISFSKLAMSNTQVSVRLLLIRPPGLTCWCRVRILERRNATTFRNRGAQITRVTRMYGSKLGDSPRLRRQTLVAMRWSEALWERSMETEIWLTWLDLG